MSVLIAKVKSLKERSTNRDRSHDSHLNHPSPKVVDQATKVIIRTVQRDAFREEFDVVARNSPRVAAVAMKPKQTRGP